MTKGAFNLCRPDFAFAAAWLLVLAAYVPIPTMITPALGADLTAMVLFNIIAAPVIYYSIYSIINRKFGPKNELTGPEISYVDTSIYSRFLYVILSLWFLIYSANVIYSGGVPFIWYLTDDRREYLNFGILSVAGVGDMLRSFAATLCILLSLATHRRRYALIWLGLLGSCIVQVSRGALLIFLLQNICMFLLLHRLRLRHLVVALCAIAFGAAMFVLLGTLRGIEMRPSDYAGVDAYFGGMPVAVYWVWAYLVSPFGNVAHAVQLNTEPLYYPYFTLVYLTPSVLREGLFAGHVVYTPLTVESLNATSMYGPLVSDFGIVGAAGAMTLFQIIASYVYVLARRGKLFYVLLYPSIFSSIVLSLFHIFALTPGVLLVPMLCVWLRNFTRRKKNQPRIPVRTNAEWGPPAI